MIGASLRLIAFVIDTGVLFVVMIALALPFHPYQLIDGHKIFAVWFRPSIYVENWLYFALLESSPWQATIGKKLIGRMVTDVQGNRIGFVRASIRYWSKYLSAIIFGIGFLMIAFTEDERGLHDYIAGTIVQ